MKNKLIPHTNDTLNQFRGMTRVALCNHLARLNKELPEMRSENQRLMAFLQDAAAYLRFELAREGGANRALVTLTHDINGLVNDEPCFLPRVHGYAKAEQAMEAKT